MRHFLKQFRWPLAAVALAAGLSAQANPVVVTLDFEKVLTANPASGIYANAIVGQFYNGGTSGAVDSATGPDYDTVFVSGSLAIRSLQSSGTAFFAPSATGPGALVGTTALALVGQTLRIDFLEAVTGDLSLTYSSPSGSSVELLGDELDAEGNRIPVGALSLKALDGYGSEILDVWARETISLTGEATSLFIRGVSEALVIDNISFTRNVTEPPPNGVPEPSSIALAVLALGGIAAGSRRRRPA